MHIPLSAKALSKLSNQKAIRKFRHLRLFLRLLNQYKHGRKNLKKSVKRNLRIKNLRV